MTPDELAVLHKRCIAVPRPFTASEFAGFLATPICFLVDCEHGFALARVAADDAELLTIAVDPDHRRTGLGRALMTEFEKLAQQRGVEHAILEVAADNNAARSLYRGAGYREAGRRRAYYRHPDGQRIDAVVMKKPLNSA